MANRRLRSFDQPKERLPDPGGSAPRPESATSEHRSARRTVLLGGRTDQDDRAVLDLRQQPVLLCTIEAMDFVDEQQRRLASAPAAFGSSS